MVWFSPRLKGWIWSANVFAADGIYEVMPEHLTFWGTSEAAGHAAVAAIAKGYETNLY